MCQFATGCNQLGSAECLEEVEGVLKSGKGHFEHLVKL